MITRIDAHLTVSTDQRNTNVNKRDLRLRPWRCRQSSGSRRCPRPRIQTLCLRTFLQRSAYEYLSNGRALVDEFPGTFLQAILPSACRYIPVFAASGIRMTFLSSISSASPIRGSPRHQPGDQVGDPCPDAAKADNGNPLSFDEVQPLGFVFSPLSQYRERVRPFNLVVVIAVECAKPSVDYLHVRFQCIPNAQVVSFILLY